VNDSARCPTCHEPLSAGVCRRCHELAATRHAQRQLVILVALVIACVGLFFFTRETAARLRTGKIQTAADWYARGLQNLGEGSVNEAVEAFRAATFNDPDRLDYSLALADALVAASRHDQARLLLLKIRAEAPDNPRINTHLARLAAASGQLAEATRYYQNALYGMWDGGQDEVQRMLRIELIRLLLEHADRESALSQILVLSKNVPGDVESYEQVGQLFLDAGAPADAAEAFDRALELDPASGRALAGAGRALFDLGDYAQAQRRLRAAVDREAGLPETADLLEVVSLQFASDPMAPRLSAAERQRRLQILLDRGIERLESCPPSDVSSEVPDLLTEATELRDGLRPGSVRADPNLPEIGVELIGRVEESAATSCGPATPLDRALALIARRYGNRES